MKVQRLSDLVYFSSLCFRAKMEAIKTTPLYNNYFVQIFDLLIVFKLDIHSGGARVSGAPGHNQFGALSLPFPPLRSRPLIPS